MRLALLNRNLRLGHAHGHLGGRLADDDLRLRDDNQHLRLGLDLLMRAMGTSPALLAAAPGDDSAHIDDVAR